MRLLLLLQMMLVVVPILPVHEARGEEIVINAVGDIMLAGTGGKTFSRNGYDYAFQSTANLLSAGDIAIGNLETPLSDRGEEFINKKYRFRTSPYAAPALRKAGFNVLTLANNHILDYGATGLADTIYNLEKQGIIHPGAGRDLADARKAAILEVKGKKVVFLSYSLTLPDQFFAASDRPGTAPGYPSYMIQDIRSARRYADYVIVSVHWGRENAIAPNQLQVETAHKAIDAGADIVLGHHPHVLQGVERYRNGVIFYSLGNFAFGSMSASSRSSVIARIKVDQGIKQIELVPLNVLNREVRFQPRPLSGKSGDRLVEQVNRLSARWGTKLVKVDDRYMVDLQKAVGEE